MQLSEKELKALEVMPNRLSYGNMEISFLTCPYDISLRAKAKDLEEFKRLILEVETAEEIERMCAAFNKYSRFLGYLKIYGIDEKALEESSAINTVPSIPEGLKSIKQLLQDELAKIHEHFGITNEN